MENKGNDTDIRNEVAFNIGIAFMNKNIESIQMIIAAGGLATIVNFIDIDDINTVFDVV